MAPRKSISCAQEVKNSATRRGRGQGQRKQRQEDDESHKNDSDTIEMKATKGAKRGWKNGARTATFQDLYTKFIKNKELMAARNKDEMLEIIGNMKIPSGRGNNKRPYYYIVNGNQLKCCITNCKKPFVQIQSWQEMRRWFGDHAQMHNKQRKCSCHQLIFVKFNGQQKLCVFGYAQFDRLLLPSDEKDIIDDVDEINELVQNYMCSDKVYIPNRELLPAFSSFVSRKQVRMVKRKNERCPTISMSRLAFDAVARHNAQKKDQVALISPHMIAHTFDDEKGKTRLPRGKWPGLSHVLPRYLAFGGSGDRNQRPRRLLMPISRYDHAFLVVFEKKSEDEVLVKIIDSDVDPENVEDDFYLKNEEIEAVAWEYYGPEITISVERIPVFQQDDGHNAFNCVIHALMNLENYLDSSPNKMKLTGMSFEDVHKARCKYGVRMEQLYKADKAAKRKTAIEEQKEDG